MRSAFLKALNKEPVINLQEKNLELTVPEGTTDTSEAFLAFCRQYIVKNPILSYGFVDGAQSAILADRQAVQLIRHALRTTGDASPMVVSFVSNRD